MISMYIWRKLFWEHDAVSQRLGVGGGKAPGLPVCCCVMDLSSSVDSWFKPARLLLPTKTHSNITRLLAATHFPREGFVPFGAFIRVTLFSKGSIHYTPAACSSPCTDRRFFFRITPIASELTDRVILFPPTMIFRKTFQKNKPTA